MIRKLVIHAWKAYEDVSIQFQPGATFLVAENGIGKSSIIQAMYFALFGGSTLFGSGGDPVELAVRGGDTSTATVDCELILGSKLIEIHREISRSTNKKSGIANFKVEGEAITESEFFDLLKGASNLDRSQLAALAFMKEGAIYRDDSADSLMLSSVKATFGTDRLEKLAFDLKNHSKSVLKDADSLRKSLRDSPAKEGEKERGELSLRLTDLTGLKSKAQARLDSISIEVAAWNEWSKYKAAVEKYREDVAESISALRNLKIFDLSEVSWSEIESFEILVDLSRDARARLEEKLEANSRAQGRCESRVQDALTAMDELDEGEGVCVTCLRPLSDIERTQAKDRHVTSIQSDRTQLADLETEMSDTRKMIRRLDDLLGKMGLNRPASPVGNMPEKEPDFELLSLAEQELLRLNAEIVEATNRLAILDAVSADSLQNEKLSARLTHMYKEALLLEMTSESLSALSDSIAEERIVPMMREAEKRWSEFWGGEKLSTSDEGMSIDVSHTRVPYSQFSGGQRTMAQVMARMLAIQMTSKCPFLILDEPLEHLDSWNRGQLVSLLAAAPRGDSELHQIIVTTYEESVARRLEFLHNETTGQNPKPQTHVIRVPANAV